MQSENFDNKLRQAAEQHHPNYDEKAWAKMEKLLDREMPLKEDRRRRFIFLLLFVILLGGGVWLLMDKPWQQDSLTGTAGRKNSNDQKTSTEVNSHTPGAPGDEKTKELTEKDLAETHKKNEPEVTVTPNEPTAGEPGRVAGKGENRYEVSVSDGRIGVGKERKSLAGKRKVANRYDNDLEVQVLPGNIAKADQPRKNAVDPGDTKQEIAAAGDPQVKTVPIKNNIGGDSSENNTGRKDKPVAPVATETADNKTIPADKEDAAERPDTTGKKAVTKQTRKKKNAWSFSISAGPDISSVGFDNPGKVKVVTGAGIGYTIKERWTIRTGFYSANKVYDAKPADYKPSNPVLFPEYLKTISAECRVYEIPLTVAYNFGRSPKHGTFVAAGLSSFIMKKEEYRYKYQYPGSPDPWYYTHKEENKFKHYFSSLSLSGGYQRRINKTFSLAVEPYFKLPLAGVGYGKIKLNNAGILFSLNVSPFQSGK